MGGTERADEHELTSGKGDGTANRGDVVDQTSAAHQRLEHLVCLVRSNDRVPPCHRGVETGKALNGLSKTQAKRMEKGKFFV